MSPAPPRGPWSDLMDQVRDALEDAGIGAGEVRDEVVQGVGDALRALRSAGVEPEGASIDPTVDVVEGGRAPDSPPTSGNRPDLRVARPPTDSPGETDTAEGATVNLTIRHGAMLPSLDGAVSFALANESSRTLFVGASAHPYRVRADAGTVRLVLDGTPTETLTAGQSMDVDAAHLRVVAEDGSAAGRFLRLHR